MRGPAAAAVLTAVVCGGPELFTAGNAVGGLPPSPQGPSATRPTTQSEDPQFAARNAMVDGLAAAGISRSTVLDALRRVPRDQFVVPTSRNRAYEDTPLDIGFGQTISAPFIVGYMTQALEVTKGDRVLEIGTGSGYQTAILAELASDVFTIEIVPGLAETAASTLARLGYRNIHTRTGDGYLGWPEEAPFSRIIVTAAPPQVPQALVDQLAVGGIMVLPVGAERQRMQIIRKQPSGTTVDETIPVRFVPMVRPPDVPSAPR